MKRTTVELLDQYINVLNERAKNTKDYPYRFSYKFGRFAKEIDLYPDAKDKEQAVKMGAPTTSKFFKTIRLYIEDTTDNSREHIFERHFIADKAAQLLTKKDYIKEALAGEILFFGIQNLVIGLSQAVTNKKAEAPPSDAKEYGPEPQPKIGAGV